MEADAGRSLSLMGALRAHQDIAMVYKSSSMVWMSTNPLQP